MTRFTEIPIIHRAVRMPATWRLLLLQRLARAGVREETLLIVLAAVIGLLGGAAAWVFKWWVEFLGYWLYEVPAKSWNAGTASAFVLLLPLLPMAGGLLMSLSRMAFRTVKSPFHGLSGIIFSLIRSGGKLPHKTGLETLVASGLTIGSGGSAGPEAPIAIIGSSLGSSVGALAGISRRNLPTLVGCGAAAGIGAVFDAPIAGVLFALEVMLRDFSVKTFTPIVVSAVIGTTLFHSMLHVTPDQAIRGIFQMPTNRGVFLFTFADVPNYVVLGIFCGILAIGFTQAMMLVETTAERFKRLPRLVKPAIGAALSGLCGVLLIWMFRNNALVVKDFQQSAYVPIFAGGYQTIRVMLNPASYGAGAVLGNQAVLMSLEFLGALCVLKIVATALTLGSGGSGGVFAPSIFIGAAGGGVFGVVLSHIVPGVDPSNYALVAMGGVLAAVIQAPLMSILLLFEITRDYQVMLPIMLTAVIATVLYQLRYGESLYTLPLKARGIRVGAAAGIAMLRRIMISELALDPVNTARAGEPVSGVLQRTRNSPQMDFVVVDEKGRYLGILSTVEMQTVLLQPEAAPLLLVGDVCRSDVPPLPENETLETAIELFSRHDVECLAVIRKEPQEKLVGMLSRADAMKQYHRALG